MSVARRNVLGPSRVADVTADSATAAASAHRTATATSNAGAGSSIMLEIKDRVAAQMLQSFPCVYTASTMHTYLEVQVFALTDASNHPRTGSWLRLGAWLQATEGLTWVYRCCPLRSAEGHEIYISRKCAMVSGTIRAMLSGACIATLVLATCIGADCVCAGQFTESKGEITFTDISAPILEKVSQYMYYKTQYSDSTSRLPEFVIEPEIAMELLMAANYLDC
ncbi:unnamed protein product [Phytophthora lilii]|uniref:Elongin-C n=1 Tax=Phytophthora lilii TaxID=2077276 RepID=A0A9W6WQI8_9STRA|nr:unnamed protein product [Phytophthora lilii]